MYTQNISIPPDYFGDWRSNMPYHPEDGNNWNGDESVNDPEGKSKSYVAYDIYITQSNVLHLWLAKDHYK